MLGYISNSAYLTDTNQLQEGVLIQYLAHSDFPEPGTKRIKMSWDSDRPFHDSLLFRGEGALNSSAQNARLEEVRTCPLFTADVLRVSADAAVSTVPSNALPQYGLLAGIRHIYGREAEDPQSVDDAENPQPTHDESRDSRLFLNTNTPWSAFICGSQGSGKSHTLSCMLEAAILQSKAPHALGKLPHPLAGIVFHYDKFTGLSGNQMCEAAYLCSTGIPVKVLVSPASFGKMKQMYSNLPNVPRNLQPVVRPLLLEQHHLDADTLLKLMAVESTNGVRPLYMEVRALLSCMSNSFATSESWIQVVTKPLNAADSKNPQGLSGILSTDFLLYRLSAKCCANAQWQTRAELVST